MSGESAVSNAPRLTLLGDPNAVACEGDACVVDYGSLRSAETTAETAPESSYTG